MLSINNLSFYFGSRPLYEGISLHIKPKDKIGLIGANGTGKSTLLKLIAGEYQPDEGDISKAKDCTIGFLNQDLLSFQSDESIVSVAMQAFEEANKVSAQINEILAKMETDYNDDLIDKLAKKQDAFEALEGYTLQSKAEEILEGLGFKTADLEKPLKTFSGGWRMRVILAKMLLAKPALLLLDEPTNHLDLPSIQWLENYTKTYDGSIVIVSHDRAFLDNCVNKIALVSHQDIQVYAGNYSYYLEESELRNEIQHNSFLNQQKQIKDAEKFINRFKAKASKARQVQSRVKALDKVDKIHDVVEDNASINFNFNFSKPSGKVILELEDTSKSYGDLRILEKTNAAILRGDKIALIGANGKGKSTLLRIIDGTEDTQGNRKDGFNVLKAFFAQHQLESLTLTNEIIEELKQAGSEKTELELRQLLGCFLFSDEDIFKKIKVLSGGEKSRVALAKTLLSEANFLLLDEPTNHLDMQSVNMLIQALDQYEGSLVVVSHDRHFIKHVANKIWYIEDHQIKEYPGTYDEFMYWQLEVVGAKKEEPQKAKKTEAKVKSIDKQKTTTPSAQISNDIKKTEKELIGIESSIEKVQAKIAAIEEAMSQPEVFGDVDKLSTENKKLEAENATLETLNNDWEKLALALDQLESQIK